MQRLIRPGLLAAVLVVLVAGAFIGVSAAHGGGGDQTHDDCKINHAGEECEMNHGEEDCPMMDSGMVGMHGDSATSHSNCPMN